MKTTSASRAGRFILSILFGIAAVSTHSARGEDKLSLGKSERIIFAGNTFAERLAIYGYLETALYCAYPDHKLTVRNLGWSGDEVDLMPRPDNTGSFDENLGWHKADVIFLCFGMNESFAGDGGLESWRDRLTGFVERLKSSRFNGKSLPKLVLLSPTPHEDLGAPLPTGVAVENRNRILSAYTRIMSEVAKEQEVLFVDLHAPMLEQIKSGKSKLTVNGIHLNELGYFHASREIIRSLGLYDSAAPDNEDGEDAESLRRAILEKNYLYHLCWRPLNSYYIWGGRAWCWAADTPLDGLEQIGAAVRERDKALWNRAKPPVSAVWANAPDGPELWESPVDCSKDALLEKGKAPAMETVRRNGARPKR